MTPLEGVGLRYRYLISAEAHSFRFPVPALPPRDLLLKIAVSQENGTVTMLAVDFDIAAKGDNPADTLGQLMGAVEEWLEYLRDEAPDLDANLAPQRRFVDLLKYDRGTWFKLVVA
jgi:hypothetical protein